jgi:hypothetical protein
VPLPHDPGPHWGEVGIHGLHRQRVWDVVTTVTAPELPGDESWFVVLPERAPVVEDGIAEVARLADAVILEPPYRAHAVRREGGLWVVGATRIETVVLEEDPGGDSVELSWDGNERSVRIDGRPTLAGVDELERLGRRHATYVVTAARIVDDVWEVAVSPL